jgi:hypothetical protein
MDKTAIKKQLNSLESHIGIILGIETLEYLDKNFLSGDNASRARDKINYLKFALETIDDISDELEF